MLIEPVPLSQLTPLAERRGLRDDVYESVLELLLNGEVPAGSRLSIEKIARHLRVSPTPVREALVQLERTGLVTREALKGYRVAPPLDDQQLRELFEARLMLETMAARLATPASESLLAQLHKAHTEHQLAGERLITVMRSGDADLATATEYFARDLAFHQLIFTHCGNRYLLGMQDTLGAQLHRMRQTIESGVPDVREAIAEHAALLVAFESDDLDAPERMMREHIEAVRARSLRENQP